MEMLQKVFFGQVRQSGILKGDIFLRIVFPRKSKIDVLTFAQPKILENAVVVFPEFGTDSGGFLSCGDSNAWFAGTGTD